MFTTKRYYVTRCVLPKVHFFAVFVPVFGVTVMPEINKFFGVTVSIAYYLFSAMQCYQLVSHNVLHQLKCRDTCAVTAVKDGIKL